MRKKQKSFFNKKNKGFTVAEILVVIAIIVLLGSIVLVATKNAREKARIAKLLQFSASIYHALGANIIGEWKFEETADGTCPGSEDICDSSGNGNHGRSYLVYRESNPPDKISQLGKAGYFGGSAYVGISGIEPTILTVEAWIYPKSSKFHYVWNGGGLSTSFTYALGLAVSGNKPSSDVTLFGGSCASDFGDGTKIPLNRWAHVVVTFDGDSLRGYINGTEASGAKSGCGTVPTSVFYYVGNLPSKPGVGWLGYIDEVRAYAEPLSSAQIRQHYVQGAKKRGLTIK